MVARVKGLNEAMTKSQMFSEIAENIWGTRLGPL